MKLIIIGILFVLNISYNVLGQSGDASDPYQEYRLPTSVIPSRYSLWLLIDLDEVQFSGNVTITMDVLQPTSQITLNNKDINVDWMAASVMDSTNKVYSVSTYSHFSNYEFTVLRFGETLAVGEYRIFVSFDSAIRSDLRGLYRSSYVRDGQRMYLAATQMEPLYARLIFPCFDEPAMKAIFQINIYHAERFRALSNMPESVTSVVSEIPGFVLTQFQETIKMSTFILAFAVTENYVGYTENNNNFTVYASEHESHRTKYAYQFGVESLKVLETWFDNSYQLPKLDMINIPDFTFGAMENWGLITFREPYLFRDEDPTNIPVRIQQSGSLLITHELVHMWFGNEVTPEYWTYIWLSEGFARFFEYYITDQIEVGWRLMDQFVVNNFQSAMANDDKETARAMTTKVGTPAFINGMFDYIVYAKSASVFRMMQNVVGIEAFQKALRNYLKDRSHQTTNPDYLFAAFQAIIDSDNIILPASFKEIFETWSNDAGYPVLTVKRVNGELTISQNRFLLNENGLVYPKRYVPINVVTATNVAEADTKPTHWLPPQSDISLQRNDINDDSWYLLNNKVTGYYRVMYDEHNWKLLAKELLETSFDDIKMSVLNRAQLIDDAVNFGKANQLSFTVAFDLLSYLHRETDYVPWAAATNALPYLDRNLRGNKNYDLFEKFVQKLTSLAYKDVRINVVESNHLKRMHRLNVARLACQAGLSECISDLVPMISYMATTPIIEEMQDFVYCSASRYVDAAPQILLTKALTLYTTSRTDNLAEITRIITALGCSRNEAFINSSLQMTILSDYPLQATDRNLIFKSIVTGSYNGTKVGLQFLADNFNAIEQTYDSVLGIFDSAFAQSIVSTEHMRLFSVFHETYNEKLPNDIRDALNEFQKHAYNNLIWRNNNEVEIENWLEENMGSSATFLIFNLPLIFLIVMNIW